MAELALAGEDHGDALLVGGVDQLLVVDGPPGLDDHRGAILWLGVSSATAVVADLTFNLVTIVGGTRSLVATDVLYLATYVSLMVSAELFLRSASTAVPVPSVIRLKYFVRVPFRARAALNRRAVFARDGHRCQYCGATAENIDHVVPRSRGGQHTWENVVAACRPCNTRKEDRLLHEAGFTLRRRPRAPKELTWVIVAVGSVDPHWKPYLQAAPATSALSA